MSTKTEQIARERMAHHKALEALAKSLNPANTQSGLQLWRKLRRLEIQTSRSTVSHCNGEINTERMDIIADEVADKVKKIFGALPPRFHVNRDPRGYALKLDSNDNGTEAATPFALHQDWGRNQILAPEIN